MTQIVDTAGATYVVFAEYGAALDAGVQAVKKLDGHTRWVTGPGWLAVWWSVVGAMSCAIGNERVKAKGNGSDGGQ